MVIYFKNKAGKTLKDKKPISTSKQAKSRMRELKKKSTDVFLYIPNKN